MVVPSFASTSAHHYRPLYRVILTLSAHSPSSSADHHQLSLILETLGTPSIDDFYAINSQRSREYIRALPFRRKKNFQQMFPGANPLVRTTPSSLFVSVYLCLCDRVLPAYRRPVHLLFVYLWTRDPRRGLLYVSE